MKQTLRRQDRVEGARQTLARECEEGGKDAERGRKGEDEDV